MIETKTFESEEKKRQTEEMKAKFVEDKKRDPLENVRCHCWVLVKPGHREVTEHLYVEPATGAVYRANDPSSPFLAIESVWNEKNYWANVQTCPPSAYSFDLTKSSCWEYVLIDEKQLESKDLATREFETVAGDNEKELSPEEVFDDRDVLDAPMSWTSKLVIARADFKARYPRGRKTIHYKRCTVEKYSEYYEGMAGLILKLTIYGTDECVTPVEIQETFAHRGDKLRQRNTYPLEGRIHEMFDPGRMRGLKDYIQIDGKRRIFHFYPNARVDGMVQRDEEIGVKVIELYENRDDFLIYRSVAVDTSGQQNNRKRQKGFTISLGRAHEQPVRKITEKYARNATRPAEEDIRKRTHFIAEGTIRLDFHYGNSYITSSSMLIDKSDKDKTEADLVDDIDPQQQQSRGSRATETRVDPNWKRPTRGQQKEALAKLLQKEKELMSKVKDREAQLAEMVTKLEQEKNEVVLEKSIYDIAQEQSKTEEKEQKDELDEKADKTKVDYLSPFLAQYPAGKPLNERQALQAKEECLATLKERLLERANIIQAHLDDENQKLQQRQALFKRQAGSGAAEVDEEWTKFFEQSAFRIGILKGRLARHEELACKKYFEMDRKLNNDPRLAVLQRRHHAPND